VGIALTVLLVAQGVAGLLLDLILRVWWFIDGLPQGFVWGAVFSVLAVVVGVGLLRRSRGTAPAGARGSHRPTEFAELVGLLRRAERSAGARRVVARRLTRLAWALRTHLEPVNEDQAWADLDQGKWPRHPDVVCALSPARGTVAGPRQPGYVETVERAVQVLGEYAKGGSLDHS